MGSRLTHNQRLLQSKTPLCTYTKVAGSDWVLYGFIGGVQHDLGEFEDYEAAHKAATEWKRGVIEANA